MYLYYEEFLSPDNDEEKAIREFILSSNGRDSSIQFFDQREKLNHKIISEFFKAVPLEIREYNASTYLTTIIGVSGKRMLEFVNMAITNGLLKSVTVKQITSLQDKLANKRLNYIEPVKKPEAGKVEIKYKEEDFFYKHSTGGANEPTGEVLWKALSKILELEYEVFIKGSPDLLKKQYRVRALALHPDRNNGDGSRMSELNYLWRLYNADNSSVKS
jgi:hypothetical protein